MFNFRIKSYYFWCHLFHIFENFRIIHALCGLALSCERYSTYDAKMPNSVYILVGTIFTSLTSYLCSRHFSKMQHDEYSFLLSARSFAYVSLHVVLVQPSPLIQPKIAIDVFKGGYKIRPNIHPDKSTC